MLCREVCSKPQKDAADGEAGWDEGKDPPGIIHGATRPVSLLVDSGGRRGVGEGVVFGSSPLSHSHLGRDWEMLKSLKSPVYTQGSAQHIR